MLGDQIKQLRKQHKWTQGNLAEQLGISKSAVGMYEQNRRQPDHKILLKLADVFGVSTDFLLDGKESNKMENMDDLANQVRTMLLEHDGLMFCGVPLNADDINNIVTIVTDATKSVLEKKMGDQ